MGQSPKFATLLKVPLIVCRYCIERQLIASAVSAAVAADGVLLQLPSSTGSSSPVNLTQGQWV